MIKMNTTSRYLLLIIGTIISLHYILSFSHTEYGRITSISNIKSKILPAADETVVHHPEFDVPKSYYTFANTTRANATFVILARNSDLEGTIQSMVDIEERFNRNRGYPYVLLNEEEFTEDFKTRIQVLTDAVVEFGVIPHDDWYQPDWIDEEKATAGREQMMSEGLIYGGSVSYRNMCRFNSGFFFKHPLVLKYRYYWRIEPDVHFPCNIDFDPFLYMQDTGKAYSFTITMYENRGTVASLWDTVKEFTKLHPEHVARDNAMGFLSDDGGDSYNMCHFWSNFEIADLDFWRGSAYTDFFEYLDRKGGFYYERWGDAPVHSIAAAIFLPKDKIQFFEDIGYFHAPSGHCPKSEERWAEAKCSCDQNDNFDYNGWSCLPRWERTLGL